MTRLPSLTPTRSTSPRATPTADIGSCARSWPVAREHARRLEQEFWLQGDVERELFCSGADKNDEKGGSGKTVALSALSSAGSGGSSGPSSHTIAPMFDRTIGNTRAGRLVGQQDGWIAGFVMPLLKVVCLDIFGGYAVETPREGAGESRATAARAEYVGGGRWRVAPTETEGNQGIQDAPSASSAPRAAGAGCGSAQRSKDRGGEPKLIYTGLNSKSAELSQLVDQSNGNRRRFVKLASREEFDAAECSLSDEPEE